MPATPVRTRKELAAALGISGAMVTKLAKRGMPVDDLDQAVRWRLRHLEPARTKGTRMASVDGTAAPDMAAGTRVDAAAPPQPAIAARQVDDDGAEPAEGYSAARTRRERAEADLAEMRRSELAGQLVRLADVDRAAFEASRALRDGLTNCSHRLSATVAVLTTPDECSSAIEREHRTLLQSWAKTMSVVAAPQPSDQVVDVP